MTTLADILFPFAKKKKKTPKPCHHQVRMQNVSTSRPSQEHEEGNHPSAGEALLAATPPPGPIEPSGPCAQCKQKKHDARIYRWKLIGGLFLPYFLAAVDLTIVAASLPWIASHFDKLDQLNWIVVSFSLMSAFIPAFGQLADVFGRHSVLQFAIFLMLVGSVLCAAAQTWAMLLLGRAFQGLSAAGINVLVEIILSDKVSLKDNAKNSTIFALVGGISFGVGPPLGGVLTNINWRYCFVIVIPPAVIAHIAVFFLLRKELIGGSMTAKGARLSTFLPALATVDIGGTALFVFGTGLIVLGTSWGGATYPWTSPAVLAPISVGAILFILFFVYEYLLAPGRILARLFPQQSAMIPSDLFKKKDMTVLAIVEFATGAAMFSVFYFIGIYFTLVEAYSASKSGVQLLYYLPGIGLGVYFAMYTCNVWPAQTWPTLSLGTTIEAIGIGLITWAVTTRNEPVINGMMVVAGAGSGMRFMPANLHAAGVFPDKIAPAMSFMQFAHPFGGTLALTIMGAVFNNKMASVFNAESNAGSGEFDVHSSQSLDAILDLPKEMQEFVRNTGKDAVMWAFTSIMPIMIISVIAVMMLGNVWIKSKKAKQVTESVTREGTHEEGIVSSEVMDEAYVWAVLTGTVESKKYISTPLSKEEKERQAQAIFEEKSLLRAARKNRRANMGEDLENVPLQR